MLPAPAASGWKLPTIETVGDLAAWFGVTPGELDWFADLKGFRACIRARAWITITIKCARNDRAA